MNWIELPKFVKFTTEEFLDILLAVLANSEHLGDKKWHPEDISHHITTVSETVANTLGVLSEKGLLKDEKR